MLNSVYKSRYYYGSAPSSPEKYPPVAASKPLWDRNTHLNFGPALITLLIPPAFFSVICWSFAFTTRYERNGAFGLFFAVVAGLAVCVVGGLAMKSKLIAAAKGDVRENTWSLLFAATMIAAWVIGIGSGEIIFRSSMRTYYDYASLNMYTSVSPAKAMSRQMLDVGIITFTEGVQLDKGMSSSFTQAGAVYCVAPIVATLPTTNGSSGIASLTSYDFWAVGMNCCGGDFHEFSCGESTNPYARAGLRVRPSAADEFYQLAIRSASEKFKIHAERPLFFQWMQDPAASVNKYEDDGFQLFTMFVLTFFGIQLFFVVVSAAAVIRGDDK